MVSGANGFVGRSLVPLLHATTSCVHLGEDDWLDQVRTADYAGATVFHLAARVHQADSGADHFRVDNVDKTRAFAQAAVVGGARRFVFLSTIKVNGEETPSRPFQVADAPAPEDAYARSKWDAEQALASIPGLDYAIVRAPLVYGAGVKGNLRSLLRLADSGLPLPFGSLENRRSFIHVDDLARLLVQCGADDRAHRCTFLAAHPQPASTARLVGAMRALMDRPRRLFPVPSRALEVAAALAGAGSRIRRLTRSLEVDSTAATATTGWSAQIAFETAVEDMVRAYRESLA